MDRTTDAISTEFLNRLRTFVRRRVRTDHDAADVVQDVLTKLMQHDSSVNVGSVYAWLFTVARRVIIDRARTRRELDELPEDAALPRGLAGDPGVTVELARCLEQLLASLHENDRALLQRVDMLGESQADLARQLGLSRSGLKSRVQRARRRLRQLVEQCCAVELNRRGMPIDYTPRLGQRGACDCQVPSN